MNKLLVIVLSLGTSFLYAATEEVLGSLRVIKITQKVSVTDCQNNFKQLEGSSQCKVPSWEPRDTDMYLTSSDAIVIKVDEGNGNTLVGRLLANVNGYYLFTFERRDEYGFSKSVQLREALPMMDALYAKLPNGEFFWKLYRMQ